jgi:hypothetical protein
MPSLNIRPWPGRPRSWDLHLNHLASRAAKGLPVFTDEETLLAIRQRRGAWGGLVVGVTEAAGVRVADYSYRRRRSSATSRL